MEPPAQNAPKAPTEGDDLFDFDGSDPGPAALMEPGAAPAMSAPRATTGAAIVAKAEAAAVVADAVDAGVAPIPGTATASPRPRQLHAIVAGAVLLNAMLITFLAWRMESSTAALMESLAARDAAIAKGPEVAPDTSTGGVTDPTPTAHPSPLRDPAPLPAGAARSPLLEAAEQLFAKGAWGASRRAYFEVLLSLPAGTEGRELARTARLRIAQCLAREATSPTSIVHHGAGAGARRAPSSGGDR